MDPKEVRPQPEGMGVPAMMQQMMGSMCGTGVSPAAMCEGTMTTVGKTAEADAYATPEVRKLF